MRDVSSGIPVSSIRVHEAHGRHQTGIQEEGLSDIVPLCLLLPVMLKRGQADDVADAAALPKAAVAWMHPELAAARPIVDLSGVSDDELDRIELYIRARGARAGSRQSG